MRGKYLTKMAVGATAITLLAAGCSGGGDEQATENQGKAGGDLRIAAPSEQVQLVLQLTNLGRVLVHYDDTEAAVASWA